MPHRERHDLERGKAINNAIDLCSPAIDVIDSVPRLHLADVHVEEEPRDRQIAGRHCAHEQGVGKPEGNDWIWPF